MMPTTNKATMMIIILLLTALTLSVLNNFFYFVPSAEYIYTSTYMYTVSQKTSPTFLAITRESIDGFL